MEILIRLLLGFVGALCHCLKNFDSLRKDAKALKISFSIKDYLEADWLSITFSIIAVLIWPFLFEEATAKYPYLENVIRWSFLGAGFLGSYGIQMLLGKGRNAMRAVASETTQKVMILEDIVSNIQADAPEGDPIPPKGPKG